MEKLLVVVFDAESKAFEAKKALQQLHKEDVIDVFDQAVVARNSDGSATVREGNDLTPVRTVAGTLLGALIGLLGGPAAAGVGTAAGFVAGAAMDVQDATICEDFIEDVRQKLTPEKFALVAEISEDSPLPVDVHMQALGGTVFRRPLKEVKHTIYDAKVAAMKADLAQVKAEHAKAHAERKVKVQEKLNQLDSKIQAGIEKKKQRRQAAEAREKAKADFLQARAAAMKAKASAKHL